MPGARDTGVEVSGYTMGCQQTSGCGRWQLTTALVCLLGLGNIVTSQVLSVWDPVKTTCNMDLGRGVVVGNKMYIDGGEIVDQQYYKNGIDKPYPRGNLIHWQSEYPSIRPACI